MGVQKNRLIETVLLSTLNICFGWEIRKNIFKYILLAGGLAQVNQNEILHFLNAPQTS